MVMTMPTENLRRSTLRLPAYHSKGPPDAYLVQVLFSLDGEGLKVLDD